MSNSTNTKKFWMVASALNVVNGTRVRHATYKEALNEAERLARTQPYDAFYILETTEVVRSVVMPVTVESL